MAKYILVTTLNMFTYALDECEDYILLDGYLRIKQSCKFPNKRTLQIFEYYHLQEGGTLNDNILMQLNGSLRQLGRQSLLFVNGHTTNYAAMRGMEKVKCREKIITHLESLTQEQRDALIAIKESEAARLPERNVMLSTRTPDSNIILQRSEVERRRNALAIQQRKEAEQHKDIQFGNLDTLRDEHESTSESTVQDIIIGLIAEVSELRNEILNMQNLLQKIFKNI